MSLIAVLPTTTGVHRPGPGCAAADPGAAHAALRFAAAATAAGHPPGVAGARGHLHVPPQTERLPGAAERLDGALVPAGRHPGGGAQAPAKQVHIRRPCQGDKNYFSAFILMLFLIASFRT